eukprot:s84_g15.t1
MFPGSRSPDATSGGSSASRSTAPPPPPPPKPPVAVGGAKIWFPAVSKEVLLESIENVARAVEPWSPQDYVGQTLLQEAVRNHGRVDLMEKKNGEKLAVKRMPTRWVREGPTEFNEQYPTASERPWVDIGLVRYLNSIRYPYVCNLIGVFRDDDTTYVASSLATQGESAESRWRNLENGDGVNHGDLFAWCDADPGPGRAREDAWRIDGLKGSPHVGLVTSATNLFQAAEDVMLPIVGQIFIAVRWLHDLGVAHRDLSLENILLTEASGSQQVKLIDFGMCTVNRMCKREVRGKQSYQAPEMHGSDSYDAWQNCRLWLVQDWKWTRDLLGEFDAFLADDFALGVVVFAMAVQDYPWTSTKKGACQLFAPCNNSGGSATLGRQLGLTGFSPSTTVFMDGHSRAEELTQMVDYMLQFDVNSRLCLGEVCFGAAETRGSVWDQPWIQPFRSSAEGR